MFKKKFNLVNIICFLIIIQPIFDVSLYFLRENLSINSGLISIIRPLFACLFYGCLLFSKKVSIKDKKISFIYLFIYLIYSCLHLYNVKGNFFPNSAGNINNEIRYIFNYGYFLLQTINFYIMFKISSEKDKKKIIKSIIYAVCIMCLLYFTSLITNTSQKTYLYSQVKNGWKGWSISAHYLGHSTLLALPIILYAIFEKKYIVKWYKYVIVLLIILPGFYFVGSKTPLFGILAIMTFYLLLWIINILLKKRKFCFDFVFISIVTFALAIIFTSTYGYRNFNNQVEIYNKDNISSKTQLDTFINEEAIKIALAEEKLNPIKSNKRTIHSFEKRLNLAIGQFENIDFSVFDNRTIQLKLNSYLKGISPLNDKLFGYGYHNMINCLWVETDTLSIYYSFGTIGFIIIILIPMIYILWSGIVSLFKFKMTTSKFLLGFSTCLAIGVVTMVGYTIMFAQTVFYFLILLVISNDVFKDSKQLKKRKYLFMINDMNVGGAEVGLVDVVNELSKTESVDLLLLRKRGPLLSQIDKKVRIISICKDEKNIFDKLINKFILILYFSGGIFNKFLYNITIDTEYENEIAYIEGFPTIFISNSLNKKSIKIASVRVGLKKHKLSASKVFNGMKLLKKAYQKMDYIHCVSLETLKEFNEVFPGNESKGRVYYTYFNVDKILKKGSEKIEPFPKNKFNIVAVGRFNEQKGYERLIEALKDINKKDINLYFIGKNDTSYGEQIKDLINKYNLQNIYFLGVKDNPYPYIKNANMLISSSYYEGYPRVVNEAICLKQICVATNVTGSGEALQNGKLGLLVEDSISGIKSGILKVYNNDKSLKTIKNNIASFDGNKKHFFDGLNTMTNKLNNLNCLLITDIYPYNGEAFVHNEIKYACNVFKRIDIITTNPNSKNYSFDIPNNVYIHHLNKLNLFYLFSNWDYQKESIKELFKSLTNKRRFIIWGKNYYYSAIIKAKIKNLISKRNYDVLFSYWFHWSSLAIARTNYSCLKIAKSHGYDLYEKTNPQLYKKYILERIDNVYPISKAGYNELKRQTNKSNIKTYFLGTYNENKLDFDNIKSNKEITIISCSRMVSVKRIHLIIEILEKLDIKIKWIHFGTGELMSDLTKLANEKLSKKKNITYEFKGYIKNDDLIEYYKKNYQTIDLFINTSSSEGIPVTIMESSSFGIIPLATNVGGTSELVFKYLIENQSEEQIVKDMSKTIEAYYKLPLAKKTALKKETYINWNNNFNAIKNNKKFYESEIKNKLRDECDIYSIK